MCAYPKRSKGLPEECSDLRIDILMMQGLGVPSDRSLGLYLNLIECLNTAITVLEVAEMATQGVLSEKEAEGLKDLVLTK